MRPLCRRRTVGPKELRRRATARYVGRTVYQSPSLTEYAGWKNAGGLPGKVRVDLRRLGGSLLLLPRLRLALTEILSEDIADRCEHSRRLFSIGSQKILIALNGHSVRRSHRRFRRTAFLRVRPRKALPFFPLINNGGKSGDRPRENSVYCSEARSACAIDNS